MISTVLGPGEAAVSRQAPRKGSRVLGMGVMLRSRACPCNCISRSEQLERLRHIRSLPAAREATLPTTRLQCYSAAGFTDDLRRTAADDATVRLVDVDRLYHGD
ncbi:hypothetical protein [Streptomyces meridianus]|uniref:Uncharacterized protein n=1 Tax=Streptomyces meridianus TaxID=2938945 RepID=A0ABT0X5J5_9ACTN|nr:hypothetical protein [Streptomyces meridianus]MCM2576932.1 hypothetical protein [Streptomyces meridianus]